MFIKLLDTTINNLGGIKMAILKEIILDNGIPVNYHRIVSVNNITNHKSIIEIASYTNESKRIEEKEKLANNEPMDIYIHAEYLNTEYNKELNVDNGYEYLKTLEKFKDSKDI